MEIQLPDDIRDVFNLSIAYKPIFYKLTKSVPAALMLSQAWYWLPRSKQAGWFYKSRKQWEKEIGLKRNDQETARRILTRLKLMDEYVEKKGRQLWFKARKDEIFKAVRAYQDANPKEIFEEFPQDEESKPPDNLVEFNQPKRVTRQETTK